MFKLEEKDFHPIVDAAIIVLIIVDTFLLLLITFYNLNPTTALYIVYFDLCVCMVLFVEFVFRIRNVEDKKTYIKHHWYDIVAMIPLDFVFYQYLFAFRLLRLIRLVRIFALFRKSLRHFLKFIEETHLHLSLGILIFTIFAGTIIFDLLEAGVNPKVTGLWDSLWYVMPTVATTGSVDIVPVTPAGKIMSMFMMLIGLIFFGMLTASIAYWYLEKVEKENRESAKEELDEVKDLIKDMQSEITDLKEIIQNKKK